MRLLTWTFNKPRKSITNKLSLKNIHFLPFLDFLTIFYNIENVGFFGIFHNFNNHGNIYIFIWDSIS